MAAAMNASARAVPVRAEPTALLQHLAGTLAPEIARLWPAPHTGFFALPTARRHACAMLIGQRLSGDMRLEDWIARARDAELARLIAPRAGKRLMRKLARMGEALWAPEAYAAFRDLLDQDAARKLLGHLQGITPATTAVIAALPEPLRVPGVVRQLERAAQARLLARGFDLATRHLGVGQRELVQRLARAGDPVRLGRMLTDALQPHRFGRPGPPPDLPAPFVAIRDRTALERTARAFENCLRDYLDRIARGLMAIYTWEGRPRAVLALSWDPAGWRLAEVETRGNEGIEDAPLRLIVDAVLDAGVRTGPSLEAVAARAVNLASLHDGGAAGWREALELGDLWD
jgi:hypothetical protein